MPRTLMPCPVCTVISAELCLAQSVIDTRFTTRFLALGSDLEQTSKQSQKAFGVSR